MFYGIGSYGVAIALYSLGRALGCDRARARDRAAARRAARAGDRAVLAARADDLLCHDHARGRLRLRGARLAALVAHRRRGRAQLPRARAAAARHGVHPARRARRRGHRPHADLLPGVRLVRAAVPAAAARRQLAVRPRAAGDPRKSVPRRGARLSHRDPPHARERARRGGRGRGRRAQCALAALHRAGHGADASPSCSTSC